MHHHHHHPLKMLCNYLAACRAFLICRPRASTTSSTIILYSKGGGGGGGGRRHYYYHADAAASNSTWRRPEEGRLKLNFDGSSKHPTGHASIGGVYRDHEGEFVLGYAERIGKATSSVAELVALKRGLELALNNGWSNIWIEGDAKTVVDLVRNRVRIKSEEDLKQSKEISALLPLLDDLCVSHIPRQGNKVAHNFAKLGYKTCHPRVWRDIPPHEVVRFLQQDAQGTSHSS